jgi:LuxR family maltose regulon positive regulatory protein
VHLVIASRTDPPLSLARLRAREQLIELRAADLSFTPIEAAAFLNEIMRLDLNQADVAALAERTEGWIVGLQMAALSLQGRADRSGFVRAFTGSHRFVLDYLIEEVLARRWYRYHHLFADLLHSRLLQAQPDLIPQLQQRAGEWYARNGLLAEAMQAAVAAGDIDRVARLAEESVIALMDHGELSKLIVAFSRNAPSPSVRSAPTNRRRLTMLKIDRGYRHGL